MDNSTGSDRLRAATALHTRAIVIDTHCDTTQRLLGDHWDFSQRHPSGHVDIPRLRDGGVSALFLAVWAPGPLPPGEGAAAARRQLDRIHEVVERFSDDLSLVRSAAEIRQAKAAGRIGLAIGIEGGYLIEDSLDTLREYHARGASDLTLTHSFHTSWADSSGVHEALTPRHGGLTAFGREVIGELNRLGMMVDVSHVSDETFRQVIEISSAPVIATHSSCRRVSPHRRNLTDEMIRAVAERGGSVQINFAATFLDPDHPPIDEAALADLYAGMDVERGRLSPHVTPLTLLVDHFDHALQLVGPAHVGIGSDFDGVPLLPEGMEDCPKLPRLTAALLERGYSEDDLAQVLGENVLRVMDACVRMASND